MENFLFIIREDIAQLKSSQEIRLHRIQEMTVWSTGLAESGNYVDGNALQLSGNYVARDNVLSDGPFIESKECISGFMFINAESIEQATAIAQTCPYVMEASMSIEVRPVLTTDNNPKAHV